MEMKEILKVGKLISVSKAEDEGPGSASFSICTEGEYDRDGDMFKVGSLELERDKATMMSFQHAGQPAGVWTMSRNGADVIANVEFLDTVAGQDTRKYLQAMGESAQFSFRARSSEWNWDDDYGMVFEKATVYESSPVLVGAGNQTSLETIKSRGSKEREMDDKNIETMKEAYEAAQKAQLEATAANAEVLKGVGESLTAVGETLTAVKDAVTPKEPKADPVGFNIIKQYNKDNPVWDLSKELFSDQRFKDYASNPAGDISLEKAVGVDLMKASINAVGTIQAAPAVPAVTTPLGALDVAYVQPWNAEVYRRRIIDRTEPAPLTRGNNGTDIANSTTGDGVTPYDYNMRTIASKAVVSRLSAMSDPAVLSSLTEMGLMDVRVALQNQIVAGSGSGQNLTSLSGQITSGTFGGDAAYTDAAASGDAAKGILNGTNGLNQAILKARSRGGAANYVLAGAADVNKIYASLENKRSPFLGTQQLPYGAPMGAGVILSPQMPANTIVVASMGMPLYHVVPIMGSFRVNVSYDANLASDEVLMTFVVYAQNVVQNPGAFHVLTGTNNLAAE